MDQQVGSMFLAFGLILLVLIIRMARDSTAETLPRVANQLSLRLNEAQFRHPSTGAALKAFDVVAAGTLQVAHDNATVRFIVTAADVTDDPRGTQPVRCELADFADQNGNFRNEVHRTIQYASADIQRLGLGGIPAFAFIGPFGGARKVRIVVEAWADHGRSSQSVARPLTRVSVEAWMELRRPGYVEQAQVRDSLARGLAMLGFGVAAATGRITDNARNAVEYSLSTWLRALGEQDSGNGASRLSNDALNAYRGADRAGAEARLETAATTLRYLEDDDLTRTAYELAVTAVTASGRYDARAKKLLARVAASLGATASVVDEVHRRLLKSHMFEADDLEGKVGMPSGLTVAQKRAFLQEAYRTWRARAQHKDERVRAEANDRLSAIATLRAQLPDEPA